MRLSPGVGAFLGHTSPAIPVALEPVATQAHSDAGMALVRLSPVSGPLYGHMSPPLPSVTEMIMPAQARSDPGMPLMKMSMAMSPVLGHASPSALLPVAAEQPVPTQASRLQDLGSPRCPATPGTPRRNQVCSTPLSARNRDVSPRASPKTPRPAESGDLASVRLRANCLQLLASTATRARQPILYEKESRRNEGAASYKIPSQAPGYPATSLLLTTPRSRTEASPATYGRVYVSCGAACNAAATTSAALSSPSLSPCRSRLPAELDVSYNSSPSRDCLCHSPSKQQQQQHQQQQKQKHQNMQGHTPLPCFGVRPVNSEVSHSYQITPRSSPAQVLTAPKHQRTGSARIPASVAAPSILVQPPPSPIVGASVQPTTPRRRHPTATTSGSLSPSPAGRTRQAVSPVRTPRPPRAMMVSPSPARHETFVPSCVNWPGCTPQTMVPVGSGCTPQATAPSPRTAWGMVHGETCAGQPATTCVGTTQSAMPPGTTQMWHMTSRAFAGSSDMPMPIILSGGGRSEPSSPNSPSLFPAPTLEDRLTAMRRACDEASARLKTQPGLSPLCPVPTDISKIEVPSVLPLTPRRRQVSASPVRRWQSQPPLPVAEGGGGAVGAPQPIHTSTDSPRYGFNQGSPGARSEASSLHDTQEDELSPVPSIECYVKADVLRKQLDVIEGKRRNGRHSKKKLPQARVSR